MRFEFQTLEGSHLGYAALQSIFQNEISHDLKVPHINMEQLSAKPSILMKCLVKEIYDKAGIASIVLWKELDFGQAGIFWINQQGSFSDKKKKKEIMNAFERNRCQLKHSFYSVEGLFGVELLVHVHYSLQATSVSYLEKALTVNDLQNEALSTRRRQHYFYSYIFINKNVHKTILHPTFCREGPRNTIRQSETSDI